MKKIPILPDTDPHQSLRIRRFLMACLVYLMAIALMGLSVLQGFMAMPDWLLLSVAIVLFNGLIYATLRSGRNEALRDPSLTALQMAAAALFMGATVYLASEARGALLLLYLVLLIFGILRMRPVAYMALVSFALLCYAGAMALALAYRPGTVDVPVEILQLAALTMLVPCGGFLSAYVGSLRARLRERQVALQRAQEAVHELTRQDDLTGVYNRRCIMEMVEEERARAERLGSALSVVMVDLDAFKGVNREFGHHTGDDILQRVASALRGCLRPVDGLGRYGGEEFLVVLPDTALDEAMRMAERMRTAATACRPAELAARMLLKASAGVAEYTPGDASWNLVGRASAAADDALRAGGNRTMSDRTRGSARA